MVGEFCNTPGLFLGEGAITLVLTRVGELADLSALRGRVGKQNEEVATLACLVGAKFGRHLHDELGDPGKSLVGYALGAGDRRQRAFGHGDLRVCEGQPLP